MRITSARAALMVAVGVGLLGPAQAVPDKPSVNWARSWEEAVEEATARNVPIFVTFHQDH